jgi:hypothetical protein
LTIGGAIHTSPFCVDLTVQAEEMKGSEYWVVRTTDGAQYRFGSGAARWWARIIWCAI